MYDMRYYRFTPNGVEHRLDCTKDQVLIGQTLLFRSPMTCASAARGHGVCYRCYGDLAYANRNINIGQIAAELLSSIYTQTLLSAKHLLESAIIKMEWVPEFFDFFAVEFDQIILKDNMDYSKMKIILDDIIDDDSDEDDEDGAEMSESTYVYSFIVKTGNGSEYTIRTNNSDPIYLHNDLVELMNNEDCDEDGVYEIEMEKLRDMSIFIIDIQNDELSKVMKQVKNLIDNKTTIKSHNRNSILETFIDTNLSGHIKINAVHFEILLMNQIRSANDILELPDWSNPDEPYQIIALGNALTDNLSVTVRLQSPKLKRNLNHPSNKRLYKPSNMDLFYAEQPQEFINKEFKSSLAENERDRVPINPIKFHINK